MNELSDWKEALKTENLLYRIDFDMKHFDKIKSFLNSANNIVIYCSVREAVGEDIKEVKKFMGLMDSVGVPTYFPFDYNQQKDAYKGLQICNTMAFTTKNAKIATIFHKVKSGGTAFDSGNAEIFDVPIYIKSSDGQESFLDYLKVRSGDTADDSLYKEIQDKKRFILENDNLEFALVHDDFKTPNKIGLLEFGMIYGALKQYPEKRFKLLNKDELTEYSAQQNEVKPNPIPKSYTKVALILDDLYQGKHIDDILKQQYL
jgi:hypothetical protein